MVIYLHLSLIVTSAYFTMPIILNLFCHLIVICFTTLLNMEEIGIQNPLLGGSMPLVLVAGHVYLVLELLYTPGSNADDQSRFS